MSSAIEIYSARWGHKTPDRIRKAVGADTSALTYATLLTYPCVDLAGDYLEPGGCDFSIHQRDPIIDLEHRRHPRVKGMPIAWARESLSEPGAPYAVQNVRLNFAQDGAADDFHTVPVGTEFYDKACPVSMQVFALREQGLLPAASLEFEPVAGFHKAIGYSRLERRDAIHFLKCRVHRWTACAMGVNPGALGLIEKAATQVPPPIAKLLRDRRVNVGGTEEPLHGVIFKALSAAYPLPVSKSRVIVCVEKGVFEEKKHPRDHGKFSHGAGGKGSPPEELEHRVMVTHEGKEVDSGEGPFDSHEEAHAFAHAEVGVPWRIVSSPKRKAEKKAMEPDADLDPVDDAEAGAAGSTPTAQAAYDLSQGASDLAAQVEASAGQGEHKKGKKRIKAILAKLAALAEEAMSVGKMIDADLADDGETAAEPDADPKDMEPDEDDGVLKGIPPVYKKAVKRFTLADIEGVVAPVPVKKAPKPASPAAPELPLDVLNLIAENRKLRGYAGTA